ncbi:hypothetical protein Asn12ST33_04875 [Cutibacterium acnes]|nr:hypothetical protein Asn12ST33_04875 [Cutibacterium acnes]
MTPPEAGFFVTRIRRPDYVQGLEIPDTSRRARDTGNLGTWVTDDRPQVMTRGADQPQRKLTCRPRVPTNCWRYSAVTARSWNLRT